MLDALVSGGDSQQPPSFASRTPLDASRAQPDDMGTGGAGNADADGPDAAEHRRQP
jgi:hypothetical protein